MLKIISANLNGIRSAVSKGFIEWMLPQDADFVCLQELKAQPENLTKEMLLPGPYTGYFHCAAKPGYSGVGIYTKLPPREVIEGLGVPEIDAEGRYLELVYDGFSVVSVYLPSGSSGEHRQLAKIEFMTHFFAHLAAIAMKGREIVICGDWNIAHREVDLKNWKGNLKNSGFLPEERLWLTRVFDELGWVDVFRQLEPDATDSGYTWWSNRGQAWTKNVGWRIDYQIATPGLAATATTTSIHKASRFSDHAPLTVSYDFTLQELSV